MTGWTERIQKLNRYYLLGLLLAIGGCGGVLLAKGGLLIAMIGVYVIGLGLAWFNERDPFYRFLLILLPVVIFISVYTVARDDRVREPAVWLVPENYTGPVYVFINEKCGDPVKRENGYRIYSIPENGLALSQDTKNFGTEIEKSTFFKINEDGTRYPLRDIQHPQDTIDDVSLWRDANGQPHFAFPGVPLKGESEVGRYYLEYAFIGTYEAYMAFVRTATLPEVASEELLEQWQEMRKICQ